MKKLFALFLALILVCTLLCACKASDPRKGLYGEWTASVEGVAVTIVLNEDGTGNINAMGGILSYDFNYTAEDGKITLDSENDIFEGDTMNYTLDGDKLTLSNEGEELVFTRK